MDLRDIAELTRPSDASVLLLVLDGLGGLPMEPGGPTALEAASTPHLDDLFGREGGGLHVPVAQGIPPGSGPGHLALFGYDPLTYRIGRGVLEALGVGFELEPEDVAVRGNFATADGQGRITDRRAGRISSEAAAPLCDLLDEIEVEGVRVIVRPVKEHRFLLVLRFPEPVSDRVGDTDPGRPGVPAEEVRAESAEAERTAAAAEAWLRGARERLAGKSPANTVLLRGFASLPDWPRFPDVFGMRAFAAAAYPMYRGVSRLVGMEAVEVAPGLDPLASALEENIDDHDFFFLHVKDTDRAGEDGDFDAKVAVIEETDAALPRLLEGGPEVVLVTGDHSTPCRLRSHSWHPVPFLLTGGGRAGPGGSFGETACRDGGYGLLRGHELMPLAAANAGRLGKYGA